MCVVLTVLPDAGMLNAPVAAPSPNDFNNNLLLFLSNFILVYD
jgi:hypothetical protein